jgi:hypothetical protein
MAQNNLRILYQNKADTATVTVSSTASSTMTAANLINDLKGVVWRSGQTATTTSNTRAHIKVVFPEATTMGCIVLAYSNLKAGATVDITGYTGTPPTFSGTVNAPTITYSSTVTNLEFDTGPIEVSKPAPLGYFEWGYSPLGIMGNDLGKHYAVAWIPLALRVPVTSIVIEVTNSDNIDRYIQTSRLIIGDYWSPKYNTSFGLTAGVKDLSTAERSEAGDLITVNGSSYTTLSFDLKYLDIKDRNEYNRVIKTAGMKKPIFVSLFPEDQDPSKEQMHQIYGKHSNLFGINHPIFDMYATQVEIEEV